MVSRDDHDPGEGLSWLCSLTVSPPFSAFEMSIVADSRAKPALSDCRCGRRILSRTMNAAETDRSVRPLRHRTWGELLQVGGRNRHTILSLVVMLKVVAL